MYGHAFAHAAEAAEIVLREQLEIPRDRLGVPVEQAGSSRHPLLRDLIAMIRHLGLIKGERSSSVMPGFMPGIHVFAIKQGVDGRDKPGHDAETIRALDPHPSCPALCRASTSLPSSKAWMAGTSPAMTLRQ